MSNNLDSILLVEDDPNDIILIRRAFRQANFEPTLTVIQDGDAAITYFYQLLENENQPLPELILLDLKLPRRSGLEVLQWLRQQPRLKRLLIVALTASKESSDVNKAYEVGINSYLVKPIAFEELVHLVNLINVYWLQLNEKPNTLEDSPR
ncbi:MAG: response regulator [Microcoleaceae cyanobacterium]